MDISSMEGHCGIQRYLQLGKYHQQSRLRPLDRKFVIVMKQLTTSYFKCKLALSDRHKWFPSI